MEAEQSFKLGTLKGAGKQIIKYLARLKIFSIQDLLFHLPVRYQDRTKIQKIRELTPGHEAVIEGVVQNLLAPKRGRSKLLCELKDETGKIYLRFFHVLPFQLKALQPGSRLRCFSEVRLGSAGLEMIHPEFRIISAKPVPIDDCLTPIYPTTEGLNQYWLRKLTSEALIKLDQENLFPDLLPAKIMEMNSLPSLKEALRYIHRPPQHESITNLLETKTSAHKRLIFEELIVHRMGMLHLKNATRSQLSAPLFQKQTLIKKFLSQLPFSLTKAQHRVSQEIARDLELSFPMLRLLQGDVGSGKTVIAALAMLQAVENGYQAVMMAPTELLAEQHYRVLKNWFEPLGVNVVFLSGKIKTNEKKSALNLIAGKEAQIILGTHALFQDEVYFHKLALIIVDEQHRFGVEQRTLLSKKALQTTYHPHQLIMTATPIPRTLAMSFYADLDCSTIDELPAHRIPITTSVMANSKRDEVITRIRKTCEAGRQCYWVCPLIEESDVLDGEAASQTAEILKNQLHNLKIGLIHGRMRGDEKEAVMRAFQQNEIHLLVATTIIEVGMDVPNATVMIIENAERLGLAQLHQLRGRVGRGSQASHCILLYQSPLSELASARLAAIRETTDGFQIAQRDLELRGPGEVLGTKQTGAVSFRVADLLRDNYLLTDVQKSAEIFMREHSALSEELIKRWLGEKLQYGKL